MITLIFKIFHSGYSKYYKPGDLIMQDQLGRPIFFVVWSFCPLFCCWNKWDLSPLVTLRGPPWILKCSVLENSGEY